VRIALLERFSAATRDADVAILRAEGADVEVEVWDLAWRDGRPPTWGEVLRAVPAWVSMRMPWRWRARLARVAWASTSYRRALVVRLPGWVGQLRAGAIDEVTCFSAAGLPVAEVLASRTSRPLRELVDGGTRFLGEFAFEQFGVIPYAHWLHRQGRLRFTVSTADTRCLYYFSPRHIEIDTPRDYLPVTEFPVSTESDGTDREAIPAVLDTTRWCAPPYREQYGDDPRFRWPKPAVVVCNKTSAERYLEAGGRPTNAMDAELVLTLVDLLRDRYTVIYNRPRESDIVGDHDPQLERGDLEALADDPDVLTIQRLHASHPDLSFNELQLRVLASAERFVSVLGGSAYLASYFGGTNIVFARAGQEVDCGAFTSWFHEFSGARIIPVATPEALLGTVAREWTGGPPSARLPTRPGPRR
jgi:hypothetical protein